MILMARDPSQIDHRPPKTAPVCLLEQDLAKLTRYVTLQNISSGLRQILEPFGGTFFLNDLNLILCYLNLLRAGLLLPVRMDSGKSNCTTHLDILPQSKFHPTHDLELKQSVLSKRKLLIHTIYLLYGWVQICACKEKSERDDE